MHVFRCQFLVSMTLFVKDIKLAFLVHACDQILAAIFAVQICLEPEYVSKFEFMKNEVEEYHLFSNSSLFISLLFSEIYRQNVLKSYKQIT